jgi:hypothetical protein
MSKIAHITTGVVSAVLALSAIIVWNHFHPAGTVAKVDIIGIVTAQQKSLAAKLKPGMDEKAQSELINQASRFGKQLDSALAQVADECRCTLLNSAAVVRDAPAGALRDYTQRVAELAQDKK